jgi:hypothetical protein
LANYQVKLVNEFIGSGEVESAITGENSENPNAIAEACKKWNIFIKGGFKALNEYKERIEKTKELQKKYSEALKKVIIDFEPELRKLMKNFDDNTIECIINSELFIDVMTNINITKGKVLKL